MVAADRDAGWMDWRVARIRERGALLVSAPGRRDVAAFGVGGEKENVPVTAGREHDGVAGVGGYFAADQIPHHDAFGVTADQDQVEHLSAWKHCHRAEADLPAKRLVSAEQELLAGLSARVERARHLRAVEGTIVGVAAVVRG